MDAIIKKLDDQVSSREANDDVERPSRAEAEEAVRTLIRWAGDNPGREGLCETPRRVAKAYEEFFAGYGQNPRQHLTKTFSEVEGYDDMIVVRDIDIESHCEHHMLPIVGMAHVAYLPAGRVVGLSKLARVVEIYARRLQTQESMTAQIADAIEAVLEPRGVAVMIDAAHQCMTTRGVSKKDSFTVTTQFRGAFLEDERLERRFFELVRGND